MPFIIAKTVTYVSSLSVTYVTTLYIPASRNVTVYEWLVEWHKAGNMYKFAGTFLIIWGGTAREADSLPYRNVLFLPNKHQFPVFSKTQPPLFHSVEQWG